MRINKHKHILKIIPGMLMLLMLYSCNPNVIDTENSSGENEWLISQSEVKDGGPGKDGIPALTDPLLIPAGQIDYLNPEDLIIAVRIGETIIAFPHKILDKHEIINVLSSAVPYILSYCPLTGTGMAWEAPKDVNDKSYGVSGLLYNSNLILYDRQTDSNWSQMMMKCINGQLIRQNAVMIHVIETKWSTWKMMYPDSLVVSNATGYNSNYSIYPYGNYKSDNTLLFPVNNEDNRLHKKKRVHGVIVGDSSKVYIISNFTGSIQAVNDKIDDLDIVVAINAEKNFAVSFERTLEDGTDLTFSAVQDSLPVVLMDNKGTKWDVFGNAVSGPRIGSKLKPTLSYNAYWFAWAAFFPDPLIY